MPLPCHAGGSPHCGRPEASDHRLSVTLQPPGPTSKGRTVANVPLTGWQEYAPVLLPGE